MPPHDPPRRILLVRLSHLGDVVHSLPVYHALRERFPGASIAWAIQPEFSPLVEGLPGIDRVLHFDRRGGVSAWWRLGQELRRYRPDWTVDAQGNLKSAAVTLLARARRRSGLHASDWTEALGALVLNDPASRMPKGADPHAMDRSLHLASHCTGVQSRAPSEWLPLEKDERDRGRALCDEFFGESPGRAIVLQLSGPTDVRAWPFEHQKRLLQLLSAAGTPTLALSGPSEKAFGLRMQRELADRPFLKHWVGQRGLRELASFFHAAAERGLRMVSCDSGPLHLAAACGLPVICLSGPQDPRRTGPWPPPGQGSPHTVLQTPAQLFCAPCLARRCSREEGPLCMQGIDPARVAEVIRSATVSPQARSPEAIRAGR